MSKKKLTSLDMNGSKGDNPKDPYLQGKPPDPKSISERKFVARMGRLQQAVGVENDAGLAKALGISHQSVASARKRRQLPYAWVAEISEKHGISSDWLLHGEGSMRRRGRPGAYGEATILDVRRDVDSEWTYKYFSISGRSSEFAARTKAEVITPRNRATSAPGYPIFLTAS